MDGTSDDAVLHRRRRRRVVAAAAALVVAAGLAVVLAVAIWRSAGESGSFRKRVGGDALRRVSALVVVRAHENDGDVTRVQRSLERSELVEAYTPMPRAVATLSISFDPTLPCAVLHQPTFLAQSTTPGRSIADRLQRALGNVARVYDRSAHEADVTIFMRIGASTEMTGRVRAALDHDPTVVRYEYLDHRSAFDEFRRIFTDDRELVASIEPTDLPESFEVFLRRRASVGRAEQRYGRLPGVDAVVGAHLGEISKTPLADALSSRAPAPDVDAEIFMKVDATQEQVDAVRAALAHDPAVGSVRFVDQAAAQREFRRLFRDEPQLIDQVTAGDLPQSFRLRLRSSTDRNEIEKRYRDRPGVGNVIVTGGSGRCRNP